MNPSTYTKLRSELKSRAESMTRMVCDITARAPTRPEVERLDYLRGILLCDWDAINRRWTGYTPEESA